MKIVYILRHIPVPSETFVINEIITLQSLGLEIFPISLLPAEQCHEALMVKIKKNVLDLSNAKLEKNASSGPFYPAAEKLVNDNGIVSNLAWQAALVAEHIKEHGIDHIHAHFATESALVAMLASKLTGIPYSFTTHAYDIYREKNPNTLKEDTIEKRLRMLVENATRVFAISEFNRKYIISKTDRYFSDKIKVLHCGIDPERFRFLERKQGDVTTFLTVGRLVEKKGHDYLIQAFKNVSDIFENVELRIAGEGPLEDALRALVQKLGMENKVVFLGSVSSDVIFEEMKKADIFVLHSVTGANGDMEGIPVSLMEASSTGLPVISTIHSGIPELVINGITGFLSREKDIVEFSNYMISLVSSRKLRERMGRAGRKCISEKFNLHMESEKLKNNFMEMIAESKSADTPLRDSNLVDIIMPTYNPDLNLIRRAIQSILNQQFKAWKLFIVKDGGNADISSVVKEFNDARINYYEIPHSGKPTALNTAISKGRAKYIAYLDDDDIWYPDHLQSAISYMKENNIKFLHTDAYEVTVLKEDDTIEEISRKILHLGVITDKTCVSISHINAVHEREFIDKAGPYDENRRFFIDWDMFLRMAQFSRPVHLNVVTCEHYIYVDKDNKQRNIITGIHKNDPELSWKMQTEMFKRAFLTITPEDFLDFIKDYWSKIWLIENSINKDKKASHELAGNSKNIEELHDLHSEQYSQYEKLTAEKDRLLEERERRINELEERIQDLLNSVSWRVTGPLRKGYDVMFKFKSHLQKFYKR